jgi:hypothetical protein
MAGDVFLSSSAAGCGQQLVDLAQLGRDRLAVLPVDVGVAVERGRQDFACHGK